MYDLLGGGLLIEKRGNMWACNPTIVGKVQFLDVWCFLGLYLLFAVGAKGFNPIA